MPETPQKIIGGVMPREKKERLLSDDEVLFDGSKLEIINSALIDDTLRYLADNLVLSLLNKNNEEKQRLDKRKQSSYLLSCVDTRASR